MMLLVFIVATLLIIGWLFWRDRRYREKQLPEVISPDVRKLVNLPTGENAFLRELNEVRGKKLVSKEILKDLNGLFR